jgi:hypothetical protein
MRRFLDFPVQAHLERVLRVQRRPTIASVPSSGPYATQSETPKESVAPCLRELTGENSPHLYRGEKMEKPHQQNATFLVFTLLVVRGIGFATFGWCALPSSAGGSHCRSCNTVNTR